MHQRLKHKGRLAIVLAVILALGMAISVAVSGGRASPVSNAVGVLISPVQRGIAGLSSSIGSFFDSINRYDQLSSETEQLRIKVAELEKTLRDAQDALAENERLKELLGLQQKHSDFEFASAEIIARDTSNWASSLTISAGSSMDIEVSDCVVSAEGYLVGYVSEVGANWATVTTLVDTDMEAGAIVYRSHVEGIAEGDFTLMQNRALKLTYLARGSDIVIGDLVLTSGEGGVFPKDLVVGAISEVHTEETGISEYAVVMPSVDLTRINYVFVIKSFDIVG